ncbi:Teichoic-acid-transporting ATPase [Crinalium epipsammum PCC 9333]|uniref:Teichoic-acid-transporting ATPase n=1 Tax=Crinalium epipsammum PCC 9333 TaxID=1173022 RepID=K9W2J1_9CYAN|nr:ABC transporter ATP-binding protein [Crinalium epipsammum]AFZ13630.1 Teichoic-acid-transporting ATPase [Crinalium epipsammum PCC 9333]
MSDTVIRVENLGKKYIIDHQQQGRHRRKTLRDAIVDGTQVITSKLLHSSKESSKTAREEFWALNNLDFEIKQGDRVGIIGRNGAGKSTLLKILSRITEPTKGRILIEGRVASLLEVGTGFHPELTGRENIFLNGAILGMSKFEIKRKFDEIVAFAEVEKFLDTPVKRYSSGMYVRLAFAVAAHLEPEILIVDEVLAVGDVQFQKKCIGKMEEVGREGRTILFVSHNLGIVQALCTRGILIGQGIVLADDTAPAAVSSYLRTLEKTTSENLLERTERRGKGRIRLAQVEILTADEFNSTDLRTGHSCQFIFHVTAIEPGMSCTFTIYDQYGQPVANFSSGMRGDEDINIDQKDIDQKNKKIVCKIDELLLIPGRYRMNTAIISNHEVQDHLEGVAVLEVEEGKIRGRVITTEGGYGSVHIPHQWVLPM